MNDKKNDISGHASSGWGKGGRGGWASAFYIKMMGSLLDILKETLKILDQNCFVRMVSFCNKVYQFIQIICIG